MGRLCTILFVEKQNSFCALLTPEQPMLLDDRKQPISRLVCHDDCVFQIDELEMSSVVI